MSIPAHVSRVGNGYFLSNFSTFKKSFLADNLIPCPSQNIGLLLFEIMFCIELILIFFENFFFLFLLIILGLNTFKFLAKDGIMWLNDYYDGGNGDSKRVIDDFLEKYIGYYIVIHKGYQLAIRKS